MHGPARLHLDVSETVSNEIPEARLVSVVVLVHPIARPISWRVTDRWSLPAGAETPRSNSESFTGVGSTNQVVVPSSSNVIVEETGSRLLPIVFVWSPIWEDRGSSWKSIGYGFGRFPGVSMIASHSVMAR